MLSVQSLIREISPARRSGFTPTLPADDARLRAAIDVLPDSLRLALALRCFERMPVATIAPVLGLDEAEVRRLIEEAAETVARALESEEGPSRSARPRGRSRR